LKKIILLILAVLLTQINVFSQIKKVDVQRQKDSLFVLKKTLTNRNEQLRKQLDKLQAKLDKITEKYNSKKIVLFVKKYGKRIGNRLASGKVWKGMTERMLRDSWGKPDKIHRNKEKWGVFTQWTYGKITYFFRDGKLIDWEEKK